MATRDFLLPDLGEGLTESEIVEWHVVVGDLVELNQTIADVETAKAIVQLPSPFAGTISQLYVEAGSTVAVGAPIVEFALEGGAAGPPERNAVLVGYGPPVEGGARPQRRSHRAVAMAVAMAAPGAVEVPAPVEAREPVEVPAADAEPEAAVAVAGVAETPRSTPPVRKFAADHGVDLRTLVGSGEHGLITRADVEAALTVPAAAAVPTAAVPAAVAATEDVRIPIKGVRKYTAEAMVRSAFTAPHVTEFLTIDVTPTSELIARLKASRAFEGRRIGTLTIVAKAMCIAVSRNPSLNSRWDEPAGEIIQFARVNLGIAVATPRGLVVPNIPSADRMSLAELSDALTALAETARAGATTPQALMGGTISITNVGVFGVDAGTPILNPGEAAILAVGAVRRIPWNFNDEIALRDVMTLSLSFDHRLVDGEQGSKFLVDVGAILSDPASVLAMI